MWASGLNIAAAALAAVAGALLTWRACKIQSQLDEAFGVVLVSKVGRGLLACLWLVPVLLGAVATVALLVVLWTGKQDSDRSEDVATEARWYTGRSRRDEEVPPPYELIGVGYGSRK